MENKRRRLLMCIFGVLFFGVSIGFFKIAALGMDPFQSLLSGLGAILPVGYGTLYVTVNLVLLIFTFFTDKHYIGLATLINISLVGYLAQYTHEFLLYLFPDLGFVERLTFLIIGILIMCLAASFYFVADLGVSTYDALSLIVSNTWGIGKFRNCRIVSDMICVTLAVALYLLSGRKISEITSIVGIGTVITAFFTGPFIEFFNKYVSRPLLKQKVLS